MNDFRKRFRKVLKRSLKDWYNIALRLAARPYYRCVLMLGYPETYSVIRRIKTAHALYAGDYKYLHLHRLLDMFQPKTILEFGSGSSTAVFAAFAMRTGARVCTIEDSAEWKHNTQKALGDKAGSVEFVLAPSVARIGPPNRCFYQFYSTEAFDFVYVDGPPLIINGQNDQSAVNWNVIDMISLGLYPKYIVIDSRRATVQYIAANFSDEYSLYERDAGKDKSPNYRYHSYFVRRQI